MFALVDVNSFYASCEKVFRPDLEGKPIVVVSNNDGCIISLSREAKQFGIKMGEPYFKFKEKLYPSKVYVFSSNYALYADLSSRVMQTLTDLAPAIEIYSIDEAFVNVSGVSHCLSLEAFGHQMRTEVFNGDIWRWSELWPRIARWFELDSAPPVRLSFHQLFNDYRGVWRELAEERLVEADILQLSDGRFADFVFSWDYDMFGDGSKLRRSGFMQMQATDEMFFRLFAQLRAARIIP